MEEETADILRMYFVPGDMKSAVFPKLIRKLHQWNYMHSEALFSYQMSKPYKD